MESMERKEHEKNENKTGENELPIYTAQYKIQQAKYKIQYKIYISKIKTNFIMKGLCFTCEIL